MIRVNADMASRLATAVLLACASTPVPAGEPWLAPGDVQVRHDVQLLVDSGVIELPLTGWPIPVSDLAHALSTPTLTSTGEGRGEGSPAASSAQGGEGLGHGLSAAQQAALTRLRTIAREGQPTLQMRAAGASRPMALRAFADTPREEGEVTAAVAGFVGRRFGGRLELTGVADPDDDQPARLDGSYVAGKFGNWIVTLGAQDRWWGSGWEGNLILSNNARPVPAISLDRAVSHPFESKWLSWIGPWRLTTFMGRMEGDREDFAHPLLFGMRVSARPLDGLEVSLERTAQWCGEGRSCGWSDFWNLFSGNDNAGENVDPEDEPGNQLAGYDIRWSSPIGNAPYAVYYQHTGESIDNDIPRPYRSLDLVGAELWGLGSTSGGSWRVGVEWAISRCGGTEDGLKLWDCAYNNAIFNPEGYRYRGRVLGHPMDGDGEMYSARFVHVDVVGRTLQVIARHTAINQGGTVPDLRHSIAPGPEDWLSLDVSYRRDIGFGQVEAGVGVDQRDREWRDDRVTLPRAWLEWSHSFE